MKALCVSSLNRVFPPYRLRKEVEQLKNAMAGVSASISLGEHSNDSVGEAEVALVLERVLLLAVVLYQSPYRTEISATAIGVYLGVLRAVRDLSRSWLQR